jgi:hypothetical protein
MSGSQDIMRTPSKPPRGSLSCLVFLGPCLGQFQKNLQESTHFVAGVGVTLLGKSNYSKDGRKMKFFVISAACV